MLEGVREESTILEGYLGDVLSWQEAHDLALGFLLVYLAERLQNHRVLEVCCVWRRYSQLKLHADKLVILDLKRVLGPAELDSRNSMPLSYQITL